MGFEEPEHIREFVASNEMQVFQMIIVIVEKSIAQNRVFGYFFLQRSIGVGDKLAEVEAAKDAGVAASLRADALLPPNLRTSQNKKDNEIEAKRNVVRQVHPNNQYQTSQAMVHESSMAEHTNNINSDVTNLCQDRAQVAFHRGAVDTGAG